jgi:hypothetical protein
MTIYRDYALHLTALTMYAAVVRIGPSCLTEFRCDCVRLRRGTL